MNSRQIAIRKLQVSSKNRYPPPIDPNGGGRIGRGTYVLFASDFLYLITIFSSSKLILVAAIQEPSIMQASMLC
jgi:hypothetical protein